MCRSPAGRGNVVIDGVKTRQNIIPKCQEYLQMKSSLLSNETLQNSFAESYENNGTVKVQKDEFDKTEGTVQNKQFFTPRTFPSKRPIASLSEGSLLTTRQTLFDWLRAPFCEYHFENLTQ